MPPIVSFVGHSGSGKTTLLEKLIGELKSRGYRVATFKNAHRGATFDEPHKDSARHLSAGSEATIVTFRDKMALIKPVPEDNKLGDMLQYLAEDYDIVLAEGFKQDSAAKIEVHRSEVGPPLSDIENLIAIATDEPLDTATRQLSLEDITALADLIEEEFIKPFGQRISLYVNGLAVPLSDFPRNLFQNLLLAIVSSLKGVGQVKNIKLFFGKKD